MALSTLQIRRNRQQGLLVVAMTLILAAWLIVASYHSEATMLVNNTPCL